ncbi:hypothetical protein, partial [Aerococcus mictus]|uniref:hypothetical protein n=1 Tax=Aerococcus mictus TaxID=2976810 RepID=UPI001C0F2B9A
MNKFENLFRQIKSPQVLTMVTPISWTLYIVSWPLASSFLLLTVLAYFLPTHLLRNLNLSR